MFSFGGVNVTGGTLITGEVGAASSTGDVTADLTVSGNPAVTINGAIHGIIISTKEINGDLTVSGGDVTITGNVSGSQNLSGGTVYVNGVQVYPTSTVNTITVNSGTADPSTAAQGVIVTITAGTAPDGKQFKAWQVVSGGVTLANAQALSTTFKMPANAVEVTAIYEDITPGVSVSTADELKTALEAITAKTINVTADIDMTTNIDVGADHILNIVDGCTVSTGEDSTLTIPSNKTLTLTGTGILEVNNDAAEKGVNVKGILKSDGANIMVANSTSTSFPNVGVFLDSKEAQLLINGGKLDIVNSFEEGISGTGTLTVDGNCQVTVKNVPGLGGASSTGIRTNFTVKNSMVDVQNTGDSGIIFMDGMELTMKNAVINVTNIGMLNFLGDVKIISDSNSKVVLSEGARLDGVAGKFSDRGNVLTEPFITVSAEDADPSADGLSAGEYVWNGKLFTNGGKYTVTFNLNGGTRTGGGELTQTVVSGGSATAPTVTRSRYTFTGWDKDIANVTGNLTVTASWRYKGGGSSGGGSSSGGSSSGDTSTKVTITTKNQPNLPITATTFVTATAGTNGTASVSIPDKAVTDAISKAQTELKKQGKNANGISVEINVAMPKGANTLTVTLNQDSFNSLVSAGVTHFAINGAPVSMIFDEKALTEIQKQSSGNVTITIAPQSNLSETAKAMIGTRPAYNITVGYGHNSTVSNFRGGVATLSIPYTPAEDESIDGLYAVYVDEKGNAIRVAGSAYDASHGCITFTTTHFSVYGVGYTAPTKFSDIESHWAKESIEYIVGKGLLSGTSKTTFAPNTAMTRGMLVTALGRLENVDVSSYTISSFNDVKVGSAFQPYIEWAYKKGIIQGIANHQFAPDRAITREEIAVIVTNFTKATEYTLPATREATTYADDSDIGKNYKTAVTAMQQAGIMTGGTSNKFNPKSNATRAEVSSMLHRYIKLTFND
ncbi:S-layer homology domain-containing protein [Anaerovorax sp. IOR16]|uniref:S-layer homology domain-containing protein n=1 Tax=Anaerovorax sp. IOR16 TaxID=2773458 RepID=UPI0019D26EBC|nr:S-layer homology domain-containing protein [Anaerovorax sp. IOR16]